MQKLDDLFDLTLLSEAGWSPPFRNVDTNSPLPRRSRLPVGGPNEKERSGIPASRFRKMPPRQRRHHNKQYQRSLQRHNAQQDLLAKLNDSRWANEEPAAAPTPDAPEQSTRGIDPKSAVTPKEYPIGWYIVDRHGEPIKGLKPFDSEAEAKTKAIQLGERIADEQGFELKTRTDANGNRIRSGVKKRRAFIRDLGLHHELYPRKTSQDLPVSRPPSENPGIVQPDTVVPGERPSETAPARMLAPAKEINTPGFVIVQDNDLDAPLDGPFPDEATAKNELSRVADDMTKAEITELGIAPTDQRVSRIRNRIAQTLSFRYFDPVKEKNKQPEPVKKGSHNERSWEYGDMRGKQLQMYEAGRIVQVADNNPDPTYIDSPHPTYQQLKKVFCPLILDKAPPIITTDADGQNVSTPHKPWTLKQVMAGLWPMISKMIASWTGDGFSQSEAIEVALVGMMKALINDRGMSPFPDFARQYIKGELYRAKKQAGVIKRPLREKGWANQGLTSTDNPLIGADGGEDGTVASTIKSDTTGYEKLECPTCHGAKFDPEDEGVLCTYCDGHGTFGQDKRGNPKKCPLCRGNGRIKTDCTTCAGTGRVIVTSRKEWGEDSGLDVAGGLTVDPKTGKTERKDVSIDGELGVDERAEIIERLNKAARLIERLMNDSGMTPQQKQIVALAFGLDGSMQAKPPTEVARLLAVLRGPNADGSVRDPVSKQLIDTTIKNSLRRMRNVIVDVKDAELFDWFEEYQKEYGLKDLKDTEGLKDWAGPDRPWPGPRSKADQEAEQDPSAPWFKRTPKQFSKPELINAIEEIIPYSGLENTPDFQDMIGDGEYETMSDERLRAIYARLRSGMNKSLRPQRYDPNAPPGPSVWKQGSTGEPIETAVERQKRIAKERAEAAAAKAVENAGVTAESINQETGNLCDIMESLYFSMVLDEVASGERGEEVLQLIA